MEKTEKSPYLACGKVLTAHGVRGALRVASYCDSEKVLSSLSRVFLEENGGYCEKKVLSSSVAGKAVLLTLDGICDRDAALRLQNKLLFAARTDVPKKDGAVFLADMVGMEVKDADSGRRYGTLCEILPSPASPLYDILCQDGRHVLLPAVPAFVIRIEENGGIFIRPIPGFFDEDYDEV